MPVEADQANLQQPWTEWFELLNPREVIGEGGLVMSKGEDGSSNTSSSTKHGTVALYPRHDVDFSKPKARPNSD
ncbi:hypothetical protein N7522_005035 [Penicillium canescens]|nr:hypothetical protein N7522_005035 [Penicillium canescens]